MPRFLVVLDVDSTLIENEAIELLAEAAGSHDRVRDITVRAMAGELDFAQSLRERVATLAGLPESSFAEATRRILVTEGVPELITAIHASGGLVSVVSGGFHEILDPLAERLGLDGWRANRLEVEGGRLTGRVSGPIVDAAAKAFALREWAEEARIPLAHTVAIGDGANDLEMMREAGLSVAFDAKPRVREAADVAMPLRDLAQVLPLLGLRG
ncbi:MAG: phosphoserine phosphatase [Frondihabitans sp.]|nr:phosphoserine phosphatase [Frondihabitans sp.]